MLIKIIDIISNINWLAKFEQSAKFIPNGRILFDSIKVFKSLLDTIGALRLW